MKSQPYYIFVPVLFISNTGKPNVVKLRISKVLALRTPFVQGTPYGGVGTPAPESRRGWCPHQLLNLTTLRTSPEDAQRNITKKPQDALVPIMFN